MKRAALALLAAVLAGNAAADIPRAALRYQRDLIREARAAWGVDAPIAMFAAQIHQESRWNARAISPVGAAGIGQFMPATARWISTLHSDLAGADVHDPQWGIRALVRYDLHLYRRAIGDRDCDRHHFALWAYNGGEKWVQRDKAAARAAGYDPGFWGNVAPFNAGRRASAFEENRGYTRRIIYQHQHVYRAWGPTVCI